MLRLVPGVWGCAMVLALAAVTAGCGDDSGDDDDDTAANSGGTGTVAGTTGGTTGNTGGTGADGTGGVEDTFWTAEYDPPPSTQGGHNVGMTCMECHDGSNTGSPEFLFGGTLTPTGESVEIGVNDGATVLSAYSQNNGNFWAKIDVGIVADWSGVEIRMRTSTGQVAKPDAAPRGPDCNACHAGGNALSGP